MVSLFAPIFLFAVLALGIGVRRFWRQEEPGPASGAAVGEAMHNVLRLEVSRRRPRRQAATTRTMRSRKRAAASTTSPSTASCCASRRPASPRSTTICSAGRRPTATPACPSCWASPAASRCVIGTTGLFWLNLRRHRLQQDAGTAPDGPRLHRAAVPHRGQRPGAHAGEAHGGVAAGVVRASGQL